MRNLFILSLACLWLTACGSDENSIPFVGSNKVNQAPEGLEEKAAYYSSCSSSTCNNDASRIIRQETIGLRLEATKVATSSAQDKYKMKLSLYYSAIHDENYCSTVEYRIDDPVSINRKNGIDQLGEIRCLTMDKKTKQCTSLLLKIEKTPSSVADSKGNVREGTVYALLENRSQLHETTQVFLPMETKIQYFLTFENGLNMTCLKPSMPVITNTNDIIYSVDTTGSFGGTTTPYYDFSNSYF